MDIIWKKVFCVFLFEKGSSSKYFGVSWVKERKKWTCVFFLNGERHYAGSFKIEEDAAKAVNLKCQELNITLKNPSVGVLDYEILKKLKKKVSLQFWQ